MKFESKKMTLTDGGMHHLGARKEDVCKKMVLVCSEEEVKEVSIHLDNNAVTASHREYLTCCGSRNGEQIGVISIGHGCMPMAIAVEELKHLEVQTIVKIGECQAIIPGIRPGTIIVPSAAVRSEGASREYVPDSYPACGDIPLLGKLADALDETDVRVGIVRSHDAYYTEYPVDPEAEEKIAKWAKLGVLANEHECSSMFVLAELLKMKAAAVLIVKENIADQTVLNNTEYKEIHDSVTDIVLNVLSDTEL